VSDYCLLLMCIFNSYNKLKKETFLFKRTTLSSEYDTE
jgi:hypothetical protein